MLILQCQCGHRMKTPEDTIGRLCICSKCREQIKVTKENTRPPAAGAPVRSGSVARKQGGEGKKQGVEGKKGVEGKRGDEGKQGVEGKKRIGELLLQEGLVTQGQLKEALRIQGEKGAKLVEVLIAQRYLSLDSFIRFLSRQPGVASIDLANYEIPAEIIALVPKEMAIRHEVFPIDRMGHLLTLGMACPLDSATIARLEEKTGLRVKALLCSPDDIRSAVQRYYPMEVEDYETFHIIGDRRPGKARSQRQEEPAAPRVESAMKLSGVSRLVQELNSLPALPETVQRVREAMMDLMISPREVAATINQDPPVAAKVLSMANSAAYGFPRKVDSVDLAVALMGLRETYWIVLSAAVLKLFEKLKRFDYKTYWEEAMRCAEAAKIIGKSSGRSRTSGLFTAGLLHDIGRIALLETVPDQYIKVSPLLVGRELVQAEQELIGLTHAEAGYELATHWSLPVEIAEPIRFHHEPAFGTEAPEQVAIVSLAEYWTRRNAVREGDREEILEKCAESIAQAGLNLPQASEAFDEVARIEQVRFEWRDREPAV